MQLCRTWRQRFGRHQRLFWRADCGNGRALRRPGRSTGTAVGEIFTPEEIDAALAKKKYKLLAVVHGETSTGAMQTEIKAIADAAHKHGALFLLDTVASLGGVPVNVDEWGVDICYSGSQKALSAPPGLAPITLNAHAWEVLQNRPTKVTNWYLDLTLLMGYWGKRANTTTPPRSPAITPCARRCALQPKKGWKSLCPPRRNGTDAV